jgi:hypothetical protein
MQRKLSDQLSEKDERSAVGSQLVLFVLPAFDRLRLSSWPPSMAPGTAAKRPTNRTDFALPGAVNVPI